MPGLLTLRTDLKSLKYGQDRPGGGDSGQPYITVDINTTDTRIPFDDGFVRYGTIGATQASETDRLRIKKFLHDGTPGYLFITKQKGLHKSNPRLEIPKNPRNIIQGIPENALAFGTNGLLEPTRIYNIRGANTLAQIPVNAFGRHFNKHGLLVEQSEASKYEAVVAANNESTILNQKGNNRLLSLKNKFELGDNLSNAADPTQQLINRINRIITGVTNVFNTISAPLGGPRIPKFSLTPEQQIIDKYLGGPSSVYGVGQTVIRRYSNTEDGEKISQAIERSRQFAGKTINDKNEPEEVNYTTGLGRGSRNIISDYGAGDFPVDNNELLKGINANSVTYKNPNLKTYNEIRKQVEDQQKLFNPNKVAFVSSGSAIEKVNTNQFGIYNTVRDNNGVINNGSYKTEGYFNNNFIGYKNSYGDVIKVNFTNWSDISRENRIGSFGFAKTSKKTLRAADSINLTPLFDKGNVYWYNDKTDPLDTYGTKYNIRDLVKFAIQSINIHDPNTSTFMIFRAYLTQFSDNVDAQWSDVKYVGRGNPFYIYNGFTRKIQVGFKVAALSAEEMAPMYSKLNFLMSSLMPDYENNIMRGPLHRLTVGNYLDAQLGILNSLSYTVPNDSPWEIAIDEPEGGTKQLILPHIIEVQMSFTPIGAETKGNNLIEAKNKSTSFIAQNSTGKDASEIQYYHDFLENTLYKKDKANAVSPITPVGPTPLSRQTGPINVTLPPR